MLFVLTRRKCRDEAETAAQACGCLALPLRICPGHGDGTVADHGTCVMLRTQCESREVCLTLRVYRLQL